MHGHADPDRSLPADLILVVNPASDSILARQMISALYSRPRDRELAADICLNYIHW